MWYYQKSMNTQRFYPQSQRYRRSTLASWLAERWCPLGILRDTRDVLHDNLLYLVRGADVLVPISYTTLKGGLTTATHKNFVAALDTLIHCSGMSNKTTKMAFCHCSYPFPDADEAEARLKWDTVESRLESTFPDLEDSIFEAERPMKNSVEECRHIKKKLAVCGLPTRKIVIFTGVGHARSARKIWKHFFPKSEIVVLCSSDFDDEWQPDHYVKVQRGPWLWLFANFARHLLFCTIGVERTGKFRHNSTRE